eukprot:TRINITY_DN3226_c2_g1_i2.p1 TRINITY_DN3226_c2_g1~~TRINITY_DN3226_c2_g1_i2.p1  ORF type:complete len:417 (-),score=82.06 TRINITY_DN3226_c2_g1_i2:627-1832(-)
MSGENKKDSIRNSVFESLIPKIDETNVRIINETLSSYLIDCRYSPDGTYLALVNWSKSIEIYDAKTGEFQRSLKDHTSEVYGVCFSIDNRLLATCSRDKSIIIYNLTDFSIMGRLEDTCEVSEICFSDCCNYIYSGNKDGKVQKWSICDKIIIMASQPANPSYIFGLEISPCKNFIASGFHGSNTCLYALEDLSFVHAFECDSVKDISFSPNGNFIAIGGHHLQIFDIHDFTLIHRFDSDQKVFSLQYFSEMILFVMFSDGHMVLYNTNTFDCIQKIFLNTEIDWYSFDISPNKSSLVCGRNKDHHVRIYPLLMCNNDEAHDRLIELAKPSGYVLSFILSLGFDTNLVRYLVAKGIYMNIEDFCAVINLCWDLVDLNESHGGNMHQFILENSDESDSDDDD